MQIDYAQLQPRERYKLLVSCIVPRPVALVSTMGLDGRPNVAPFSFFNAVSDEPPAVAIGVNSGVPGHTKDTAKNIRDTGEFVVNLVDEAIAAAMNICGIDMPADVSEFAASGLTPVAGVKVNAPIVKEAPISLECRRLVNVEIGVGRNIIVGEVIYLHIRDDLIDRERLHVHADKSRLIGRMHGPGWYSRTTDLFDLPRIFSSSATGTTYNERGEKK
jgi:flavin reductase (DIM6/NTAB) family NADH-FMN oxidoreductase RutF